MKKSFGILITYKSLMQHEVMKPKRGIGCRQVLGMAYISVLASHFYVYGIALVP
jgi:hypothetical protein